MLVGRVQTQEGKHRGQLQEDAGGTNLTMAACCSRKSFYNISYIGALNVSALHCSGARKARVSGGGRGQLTSLKFGAEFRNCIWRLCHTNIKVMAMTTCLTLIH